MKNLLFGLVFWSLSSCVTTPSAEEKMATWNGEKSDHLVAVWGTPSAIDPGPSGSKTYVYKVQDSRMRVVESGLRGGSERFDQDVVECTVSFHVDASDRVKSSAVDTADRQCNNGIAANPKGMLAH
ncbi:MAG: hypothetical protein NTZ90_04945 [Proteobacteria bacterium]|jgi:outer membrane protein assembly factor BamE (lipoprotein component of BamABCDE complex)|nr:hypothetical protein [Pseudomonadota bacterium]